MRLLRRALRVIAVASVTVAVGVAVNQVLNGARWNLRWLIAAVVLAVLAETLDLWLGTHDKDSSQDGTSRPTLWPSLADENGRPLPLREVTPRDLGVHPSRFGTEGNSPYIHRQADNLLVDALADEGKRVIIVEGPRLAGATSTLAQAAQVHLADYLAAGFIDDPRVPLMDMITQAGRWAAATDDHVSGVAVWLDGLSPGRFAEIARVLPGDLPPGVRVLATLDTGELEGLRISEQLDKLLDQRAVRIRLMTITKQERRDLRAQKVYAALRPVLDQAEDLFLGRVMVAWEPLRAALTFGSSEHASDRVALLRAVTDWYRVHMPRLLSSKVLDDLYRVYRAELGGADPRSPISVAGFRDALQWATALATADRPRLIDLQSVPGGQRYAPHPLLAVIADDPDDDAGWPVADALWSYANRYLHGDQRRDIGYVALARGACEAAARLLSHADTTVDPDVYGKIALMFLESGEWISSRDWWYRALNTGDPDQTPTAMDYLGRLEQKLGNPEQARHWYEQAISTGHPDAAPSARVYLANLEKDQGNLEQARRWYEQAIGTGHPDAAPRAMVNLANLEKDQGNLEQARRWYQQAIDTGRPDVAPIAMVNFGSMEYELGNLGQAERWYQRAIRTGHPDQAPRAMINLGDVKKDQGNLGQAQRWYQRAIRTGHPDRAPRAIVNFGNLKKDQGNLEQARRCYQQVIGTGHPDQAPRALVSLGDVEEKLGNLGQAQRCYQQAIDSGHAEEAPRGMGHLANLERNLGNLDRARHLYQQAIGTAHPDVAPRSMVNLGNLERGLGNSEQARYWYQQAIDTGHVDMAHQAHEELSDLDRHEDERLRGEHFGRYGYLTRANLEWMNRDEKYSETSDVGIVDQVSERDYGDSPS